MQAFGGGVGVETIQHPKLNKMALNHLFMYHVNLREDPCHVYALLHQCTLMHWSLGPMTLAIVHQPTSCVECIAWKAALILFLFIFGSPSRT